MHDDDDQMEVEEQNHTKNGEKRARFRNHKLSLTCACIDSKGENAFTGSKDGSIIKWSLEVKKIISKVDSISFKRAQEKKNLKKKHHIKHITCMAISSDDKFLATGGWDKVIRIWSPDDLSWLHSFDKHRQEVTALAFRLNHPSLYSGSADRSIMLWTLEDDENRCFVEALYGHESPVTSIDCLRKERVLTSGGRDQSVRIWKIVEQAQSVYETKHESVDVAKFVDDKTFVSGGEDGSINIWTTMTRNSVYTLKNAHGPSDKQQVDDGSIPKGLKYWITSLATFPLKTTVVESTNSKPKGNKATKKRKIGEAFDQVQVSQVNDDKSEKDSDEEDNDEDETQEQDNRSGAIALVASGSCDSKVKVWKINKHGSKYSLQLDKKFECPGFVNDLKFSNDGSKLLAACGQEHRFGRWWRLKKAKNYVHVFEINKN